MTDEEAEDFVKNVQSINPEVEGFEDAIYWALEYIPKLDYDTFHGQIGRGVLHSNSNESRWFPNTSLREAAFILAEELL